MAESSIDKDSAVTQWLQKLFGDEPVPYFDKTAAFIDHLYELMIEEKCLSRKSGQYTDFLTSSTEDYSNDLSSTVDLLKGVGLADCLSNPDAETVSLASIASDLSLSTPYESSYMLALTDLLLDKEKSSDAVESLNKLKGSDTIELKAAIRLNSQLESVLEKLSQQHSKDEESSRSRSRETAFLQSKASKYSADQKKQDLRLAKSGVTKSVTHGKLVADFKELEGVSSKLDNTRDELRKFAELPPDRDLAIVKLEVAKSELRELEDEVARQIDMSHL